MSNVKDRVMKAVNAVHRGIFRASKGRVLGRAGGMPVVELTTTGRRTGAPRTTMLTSPLVEGDSVVLVASYGGDDRHPVWYLNLIEHPEVQITTTGATRRMIARTAAGGERDHLWSRLTAAHANYAGYQRRTQRTIPVVVLDPVQGRGELPPTVGT
ncbi:nitroreductase/quinone reductase family protein [Pseudonocardia sp. H11422]|uniref:nitroreductase/quinone reductase family protein n=1 Tax=Pseudonocardia sp. H11422 TaxID=2835866 RepID=UPI00202844F9|nr:nitroreductase/quinone reductase family protein [Pseudonocardia sp. H11422]